MNNLSILKYICWRQISQWRIIKQQYNYFLPVMLAIKPRNLFKYSRTSSVLLLIYTPCPSMSIFNNLGSWYHITLNIYNFPKSVRQTDRQRGGGEFLFTLTQFNSTNSVGIVCWMMLPLTPRISLCPNPWILWL